MLSPHGDVRIYMRLLYYLGFVKQLFSLLKISRCRESVYTVTCQPIVGLGNRALLGSRPLNA
jgi:hypothetical protein